MAHFSTPALVEQSDELLVACLPYYLRKVYTPKGTETPGVRLKAECGRLDGRELVEVAAEDQLEATERVYSSAPDL